MPKRVVNSEMVVLEWMGEVVAVVCHFLVYKFGYYYTRYLLCGFCYCVATCFVSPSYDVTQQLYIRALFYVFKWASRFSALTNDEDLGPEDCTSERVTFQRKSDFSSEEDDSVQLTPSKSYTAQASLIHRHAIQSMREKLKSPSNTEQKLSYMQLIGDDSIDFLSAGIESIVDDEYGSSFKVPELSSWNLLSRTKGSYAVLDTRLKIIWVLGFLFRFIFLLPVRILILLFCGLFVVGAVYFTFFPASLDSYQRSLAEWFIRVAYRLMGRAASCIATHHGTENHPLYGGLVVANHTSPVDIIPLNYLKAYSLTGQKHTGIIGYFEGALHKIVPCLWFDRSSRRDRTNVKQKLADHIKDPTNPPLLIFPEGVCVNNTTTLQFKKGSFEAADVVYPVALKFDLRFGDPFWHQDSWNSHMLAMLTSWAIVVDLYYLPAMHKQEGEEAQVFADRVGAAISEKGGLRRLHWDGMLRQYVRGSRNIAKQRDEETKGYTRHLQKQCTALQNGGTAQQPT